jgi:uncharacterized CHY-type Zn-finger protein/uncharacterized RDD family membrane protein YckC
MWKLLYSGDQDVIRGLKILLMNIVGEVSKERFIAAFIDNLIAIALMFIVVIFVPASFPVLKGIVIVFVYLGYYVVFEALWSRTLGKYFQGLAVRKLNGQACDWTASIIRGILRVVEVNPLLLGGLPAGLVIISTAQKQRIGDILAGTVVVSDKLKWEAEPVTERSEEIYGLEVDPQNRCAHYHSELDIIAIKFKCCGDWFPCFECHAAEADHIASVWHKDERDAKAVLCGACGHQLSIQEYFACDSSCPKCESRFNPACANHYQHYFA